MKNEHVTGEVAEVAEQKQDGKKRKGKKLKKIPEVNVAVRELNYYDTFSG